jgi:hypothetical protein
MRVVRGTSVVFTARYDGSAFVTGHVTDIDGGRTLV